MRPVRVCVLFAEPAGLREKYSKLYAEQPADKDVDVDAAVQPAAGVHPLALECGLTQAVKPWVCRTSHCD